MNPTGQPARIEIFRPRALLAAACLLALSIWACASAPTAPLDPASLLLPRGSLILAAEVDPDLLGYRLKPLSQSFPVPDGVSVVSIATSRAGSRLSPLVAQALKEAPADLVLLFLARKRVEKRYSPYPVFLGWRSESIVEGYENGRAVTRKRETPRFKTEYRNRCVRIRYRILQYGAEAEPMGRVDPVSIAPAACPEQSDNDVVIDEFDAAARWLEKRIRVADR
jgi:hypothetical protein